MIFKSQYNSWFRAVILKSLFISNPRYLQLSTELIKKELKKNSPNLTMYFFKVTCREQSTSSKGTTHLFS